MKKNLAISAAAAAVLMSGVIEIAQASDAEKKEKCYGVSAIGQNDCANLSGTHSCHGQSTIENDVTEWRMVPAGTCAELGGFDPKRAKEIFKGMETRKHKANNARAPSNSNQKR